MSLYKQMSLVPKSLRYKLMISYSLMSVIPLLICTYLASNFIFPHYKNITAVSFVILITALISLLGFYVAKKMIEPIVKMAIDARIIASGNLEHIISVKDSDDEVGELGKSLTQMMQKVKSNLSELKAYGEMTKEINIDINKKVIALSGLLQVSGLISSGADLESIIDMLMGKISNLENANPTAMLMINKDTNQLLPISYTNFSDESIFSKPIPLGTNLVGKATLERDDIVIDKNSKKKKDISTFQETYGVKNALILPIFLRDICRGVLITGNNKEDYEYTPEDIEFIKVFVKQIAIAIENDELLRRVKELEIIDSLTGLYNSKYIKDRLSEEIKRSVIYQRPCSIIFFKIVNYANYCKANGNMAGESALKDIARIIQENLTLVDKAARYADDEFSVVLAERNKREATKIATDIKRHIDKHGLSLKSKDLTATLACYVAVAENPIDGASAKEIIEKAHKRLVSQLNGTLI